MNHSISKETVLERKKNPVCRFKNGNQQKPSRDLNNKSVVYNEINDDLVSLRMKILFY